MIPNISVRLMRHFPVLSVCLPLIRTYSHGAPALNVPGFYCLLVSPMHSNHVVVNNLISNDWHFALCGSICIKVPSIPVTAPPSLCILMFDLHGDLETDDPDGVSPHVFPGIYSFFTCCAVCPAQGQF